MLDLVALAERVERVLLPRVQLAGLAQGVDHCGDVVLDRLEAELLKLGVQELDVERRVVDDQLGAGDVLEELARDVGEARLVLQELVGDAVHPERPLLDLPLRVEVAVEVVARRAAARQLDAPDLDDPVAEPCVESGGLRVEDDLPHTCAVGAGPGSPTTPSGSRCRRASSV
jgi:hypothetical protein